MAELTLDRISVGYGKTRIINGVTLALQDGEFVSLIGPNGAGKTTLLNGISGQLPIVEGRLIYGGVDITRWRPDRRARGGLGRSFQTTHLFPNLTALENVALAVQAHRRVRLRSLFSAIPATVDQTSRHYLEMVHLSDALHQTARSLSHGDKRKLEFAMLLAIQPKILLLDEPTAGMSVSEVPAILDLVAELKVTGDYAIILVEHKIDVVMRFSDRIAVLNHGELLAEGTIEDVLANKEVERAYLGGHHGGIA
ncbi:ABC transporter ATP-binding protein [Alicyclobacillus dauci]|uniref:ABC transporter ATP-binding protein n=1 Tax=Alicyclobacillus dauci TaxID=1475485 RepID=A0ABY6Z0D0_9BACL|nr:ABC transporter ATP-binding protein [Alicyclobacillus dauci]WAH36174.1 ABC transporter ATP-binding protein [Alicyclobacillus dauci]